MTKTIVFLTACFSAFLLQAAFTLTENGRTETVVCIPERPSPAEEFTAREVQNYLKMISGANPEIIRSNDAPDTSAIIIGAHPANRKLAAELNKDQTAQYDRFALECKGNYLHITAPHSSGITYGGWEFLRQLGVEWLMPGRNGTYIPEHKTIMLKDFRQIHTPRCEFRSSTNYSDAGMPWMLKQKGAKLMVEEMENGYPAALMFSWRMRLNSTQFDPRDSYTILGAGHSYFVYLPIERYFKKHPEWYGLRNGKRQQPGSAWQICFTNPEAAAEFAKNAIAAVKNTLKTGIPQNRILLCVSPNDHEEFCQCANCKAMIDPDGYYSSCVLNFANLVASHIHAEYPQVKITYYVYHTYGRIPTKVKPAPGVYAYITAWTANNSLAVNNAKPMMNPQSNRIFSNVFKWFAENSSGVYVYPYYAHFEIFSAWPMQTQMNYDFKAMEKYPQFLGMNSESHLHWGTQMLNLYLFPKLLWNPKADQAELIRNFCRKAYGPAAEDAEQFFAIQQKQMDQIGYICGNGIETKELLTAKVIDECAELIEQIKTKMPEMDEPTRWRTQLLCDGWYYSRLYTEAILLLANGKSPDLQPKVKAAFDAITEFMKTEQGRYTFEVRVAEMFNLTNYRRMANVNLQALPSGKSKWGGNLYYGSSLKFYTKMRNIHFGLWGLYLPPKGHGEFDWTLKAATGKLKALTIYLNKESGSIKIHILRNGKAELIAEKGGSIKIPADYLNVPELTLRISGENGKNSEVCWISIANVTAEVD